MTILLRKILPRRTLLQAFLAVPAFSLFRDLSPGEAPAPPDEIVEVGGWILKRSDLA